MKKTNDTPYSVYLLAELYNFNSISKETSWPKNFRNEVRHELRKYGYTITEIDYFGKTTTVAILNPETEEFK